MSKKLFLAVSVLLLATLACNFMSQQLAPQATNAPTLISTAIIKLTTIVEPTSSPRLDLPRDENAVPRISVEQAKTASDSGAAVVVDVRGDQAYALEHIAGSISIPLVEIETDPTSLKLDKKQWIITYCTWQNEHTSARAAFVLIQNGYLNVTPIRGGFQAWLDAGYPVEP